MHLLQNGHFDQVFSKDHLDWINRIVQSVTGDEAVWFDLCEMAGLKDKSIRRGKRELVLSKCKGKPVGKFLNALARYFHLDGRDQAKKKMDWLGRLSDWKLHHQAILTFARNDTDVFLLEEIFQLSQWGWIRTANLIPEGVSDSEGVPDKAAYEFQRDRLENWRTIQDPFKNPADVGIIWSEAFRIRLHAWWAELLEADERFWSEHQQATFEPCAPSLDRSEAESAQMVSSTQPADPFKTFLNSLEHLHNSDPLWNGIDGLVTEIQTIAERKRNERLIEGSISKTHEDLIRLIEQLGDESLWEIQDLKDASGWQVADFLDAEHQILRNLVEEAHRAVLATKTCLVEVETFRKEVEGLRKMAGELRRSGNRPAALLRDQEARKKEDEAERKEVDEFAAILSPRAQVALQALGRLRIPHASSIGGQVVREIEATEEGVTVAPPSNLGELPDSPASDLSEALKSQIEESPTEQVSLQSEIKQNVDGPPSYEPPQPREFSPFAEVKAEPLHCPLPLKSAAEACMVETASPDKWATLVWRLVAEDKLAMAHICAMARETSFPEAALLPSWAIELALAGRNMSTAGGRREQVVRDLATHAISLDWDAIPKSWRPPVRGLLCLGLSRAAIIAPHPSEAPSILASMYIEEPAIRSFLIELVAQGGNRHQRLDPSAIRMGQDQAGPGEYLERLQVLARQMDGRLEGFGTKSAVGEGVWRKWISPDGWLRELLRIIIEDDRTRIDHCKEILDEFSDEDRLDRRIQEDRHERMERVFGSPRRQLIQRVEDIFDLVRPWLVLVEARTTAVDSVMAKSCEDLWDSLRKCEKAALDEIQLMKSDDPAQAAAFMTFDRAIRSIGLLFRPVKPGLPEEPPEDTLLREHLFAREIRFDEQGRLPPNPLCNARRVAESVAQGLLQPENAAYGRIQVGDFRGARFAQNFYPANCVPETEWTEALNHWRLDIDTEIQEVATAVENAAGSPLLDDKLYMEAIAANDQIADVATSGHLATADCRDLRDRLASLRTRILEAMDRHLEKLKESYRQASFSIPDGAPIRAEIEGALEKRELLAAQELLEAAMNGRHESWPSSGSHFNLFWPERARNIHGYLSAGVSSSAIQIKDMINRLAAGESVGPLFVDPQGGRTDFARNLLRLWFTDGRAAARQASAEQGNFIKAIFRALGFEPNGQAELITKSTKVGFLLNTVPLTNRRDQCPIRTYGSEANGKYRVLCLWGGTTPQEMHTLVERVAHAGTPTFIFNFGPVSPTHRKDLARLSKERKQSLLVVDDVLIAHLATCGESPLPSLFACTLPFTWAEPFATASSTVPPEAFFGRDAERQTILGRSGGTSLIYGGRQLGKTALLREIQRRDHCPQDKRFVIYLDLRTEQIGTSLEVDDVWQLIAAQLVSHHVLQDQVQHAGPETVSQRIREWLMSEGRETAQILVLLDEADRFLEKELKDPSEPNIRRFGHLMEETNLRFKVVFSGLHSVQRASLSITDPNTKLLHYGQPVCIGPLYPQPQDVIAARQLVEEPFAALGFEFDSPHLVTRILSHCNYYPSLVQLFCHRLHKHMVEAKSYADPHIPRKISAEDVNRAYRDSNLRREISEKFLATLRLDNRFGVIALYMAWEDSVSHQLGMVRPSTRIFEEVRNLWPAGFAELTTNLSFMTILDEMVGLGVLRKANSASHAYALRSPNIIPMLGTEQDIWDRLQEILSMPPARGFDVASFRATTQGGNLRRSPLTSRQIQLARGEARDHGVVLVAGCRASGLEQVPEWLEASFAGAVTILPSTTTQVTFQNILNRPRPKVDVAFLVVPSTCEWNKSWVEHALEKTAKLKTIDQRQRVVFLLDPLRAAGLDLSDIPESRKLLNLVLEPWRKQMVEDWLTEDLQIGQQDCLDQVWNATGGWPVLLERFLQFKQELSQSALAIQRLQQEIQDPIQVAEFLKAFGVDSKVRRILLPMAVLGEPISVGDLSALAEVEEFECQSVLEYGQRLGILTPLGTGESMLDSTLGNLLKVGG